MSLIAYGLIALALVGSLGGIAYGLDNRGYQRGKGEVKQEWDAANEKARALEAAASAKAAADLEAERKKRRIVVKERTVHVDREVEKLVYRSVCLPDSGLCLLRAAINGTVDPGCLSDGTVPATKPPG